jgi:hypothetical protein
MTAVGLTVPSPGAERAARAALRAQIARLEREAGVLVARGVAAPARASTGGPRLLGLGELEVARDDLATRVVALRAEAAARAERVSAARAELERMLADPPAHRGVRIANSDLGLPGCTTYEVRPRAGLLGRLAGWWRVKISSGCPLPG